MNVLAEHGLQAGFIPLRSGARRLPLFVIQDRHSVDDVFGLLAERGNAGFPIYGLQARSAQRMPADSVEGRAARLIETILAIQPEGPYRLAAWPDCALVAYEIATQLSSTAHQVEFIGLVGDMVRVDAQASLPRPAAALPIHLFVGVDGCVPEPGLKAWRELLPSSQLHTIKLARCTRPDLTPSRALARALSEAVSATSGQAGARTEARPGSPC